MEQVRLQKFLAECGVGSRRAMEEYITAGRVRVNGQVVTKLGRTIDPERDVVEVNRRVVRMAPKGILLLNKPRGVVSTLSDPEGRPTVADFLTKHHSSYFPVGRLDWDSTGLMILTNDGDLAERLMHPRYGFERVYEARVEGSLPVSALEKLARGVRLPDGVVHAEAEILRGDEKSTWVSVSIREGRNRLVRRVFDKLGFPVMKLRRVVYGPFKLGRLQNGQVRALTTKEYEQVRRKVMSFVAPEARATEPQGARRPSGGVEGGTENRTQGRTGDRAGGRAEGHTGRRGDGSPARRPPGRHLGKPTSRPARGPKRRPKGRTRAQ